MIRIPFDQARDRAAIVDVAAIADVGAGRKTASGGAGHRERDWHVLGVLDSHSIIVLLPMMLIR
jgi:hypothetical protein